MKSILNYLVEKLIFWLVPLLLFLGALSVLAYKVARTPDSPFIYDF